VTKKVGVFVRFHAPLHQHPSSYVQSHSLCIDHLGEFVLTKKPLLTKKYNIDFCLSLDAKRTAATVESTPESPGPPYRLEPFLLTLQPYPQQKR
jgi:hypothetical protein